MMPGFLSLTDPRPAASSSRRYFLIGLALLLGCGESSGTDPVPDDPEPQVIPVRLRFVTQPTDAAVGETISPAVEVWVVGSSGALATGATPQITLGLHHATEVPDVTLEGTTTMTAVGGVARFGDLSIDAVGDGYRLLASADDLGGSASAPFDVTPPTSSALEFRVGPSRIQVGEAIAPPVEVVFVDGLGEVVTGLSARVEVELTGGTGSFDAEIHGTPTVIAVDGVATLPHLTVNEAAGGYTLTARSTGMASVESAPFDVEPWTGSPTSIVLESDPGDPIGQGGSYSYTQANAGLQIGSAGGAAVFSVRVRGDEFWNANVRILGDFDELEPGTYTLPDEAELGWAGEGRGCGGYTGTVSIDEVTYLDTLLTDATVRFEQTCSGFSDPLRGTIHWARYDTTTPPGPVRPIPGDLWQPADGTTPSSGSWVYLVSDPGDGVEPVTTYTALVEDVASAGGALSVLAGDWSGSFQKMSSIDAVETGYYPDLQRYGAHNPAKGGLSWYGPGHGCNELNGWFAVDAISYASSGVVEALDLRFEQSCVGSSASIRGMIHWEG